MTLPEQSYIRLWGSPPPNTLDELMLESCPPERSRWRDKTDAQLIEMSKQIGRELTARADKRYDATGDARECRS